MWSELYDALVARWKPPRSFVAGVEWTRDVPPDDALTEDKIVADQPEWVPPPDLWRPRTTLDP